MAIARGMGDVAGAEKRRRRKEPPHPGKVVGVLRHDVGPGQPFHRGPSGRSDHYFPPSRVRNARSYQATYSSTIARVADVQSRPRRALRPSPRPAARRATLPDIPPLSHSFSHCEIRPGRLPLSVARSKLTAPAQRLAGAERDDGVVRPRRCARVSAMRLSPQSDPGFVRRQPVKCGPLSEAKASSRSSAASSSKTSA